MCSRLTATHDVCLSLQLTDVLTRAVMPQHSGGRSPARAQQQIPAEADGQNFYLDLSARGRGGLPGAGADHWQLAQLSSAHSSPAAQTQSRSGGHANDGRMPAAGSFVSAGDLANAQALMPFGSNSGQQDVPCAAAMNSILIQLGSNALNEFLNSQRTGNQRRS